MTDDNKQSSTSNSEISMQDELIRLGMWESDMNEHDMSSLLAALKNSMHSADEEEKRRLQTTRWNETPKGKICRRSSKAMDRRLPWSLLPSDLLPMQKVRCLQAYIQFLSLERYKQARYLQNFIEWAPAKQLVSEDTCRVMTLRSTRSGRLVPSYADPDDEQFDIFDFRTKKCKKRKISNSDCNYDSVNINKSLSLKRKASQEEHRVEQSPSFYERLLNKEKNSEENSRLGSKQEKVSKSVVIDNGCVGDLQLTEVNAESHLPKMCLEDGDKASDFDPVDSEHNSNDCSNPTLVI